MIAQALPTLAAAAALLAIPGAATPRARLRLPAHSLTRNRVNLADGARPDATAQPLDLASTWQLLAACLQAGVPVAQALVAVCDGLGEPAGPALRRTAQLLALGADPAHAWQPAMGCAATVRLAGAAQRSCRSGATLAESLIRLAAQERAAAREHAEARAQRAGVLIAAPLGLCFLPAFLATGVVPVLLGLASSVMHQW